MTTEIQSKDVKTGWNFEKSLHYASRRYFGPRQNPSILIKEVSTYPSDFLLKFLEVVMKYEMATQSNTKVFLLQICSVIQKFISSFESESDIRIGYTFK